MVAKKEEIVIDPRRQKYLFEICESKEVLNAHMKAFLKIELPDSIVDERSTSTPLQFVWEVYNTMRTNEGPKAHVVAVCRNGYKTLCSAILHFYSIVHFRRDAVQAAAQKPQSKKCLKYLKKFLSIPEISDHFKTNSVYEYSLESLPSNMYTKKPDGEVVVVAATIEAANAQRGSLLCLDEADLIKKEILSEIAMTADPTQDEHQFDPISVALSSRKTNNGPLQDKMDEAEQKPNEIRLHKWSTVDLMVPCLPEIHGEKNQTMYINDNTLQVFWKSDGYEKPDDFREIQLYEGCKTCPALVVCQGRSAKQQKYVKTLRSRTFVGNVLRETKVTGRIIAQMLNWKPESEGLAFGLFDRKMHTGDPLAIFRFLSDTSWDEYRKGRGNSIPSKADLYSFATKNGWKCNYGIDWGYTDPAVLVVLLYHLKKDKCVVLHVRQRVGFTNNKFAEDVIRHEVPLFYPDLICPDMADAGSVTYFPALPVKGKKPRTILSGVDQIRSLLWDPTDQSSNFMIANYDEGSEWLIDCMSKWQRAKDPSGKFKTDDFEDDEFTHPIDALRYGLDSFRTKLAARLTSRRKETEKDETTQMSKAITQTYKEQGANIQSGNLGNVMLEAYRSAGLSHLIVDDPGVTEKTVKKGSFKFKF